MTMKKVRIITLAILGICVLLFFILVKWVPGTDHGLLPSGERYKNLFVSTSTPLEKKTGEQGVKSPKSEVVNIDARVLQEEQRAAEAAPPARVVTLKINTLTLTVEVAETIGQQVRGLTGRPSLLKDHGMLYVLQKPSRYSYWAKDMKFATDVVWIGPDFHIQDISENITPDSYPAKVFIPKQPSSYVLEAGAGFVKEQGLKIDGILDISGALRK